MSPSMWRIAGGLAIGYVVLMLAGLTIGTSVPEPGAAPAEVAHDFSTGSAVRMYAALYVTALSLLMFLAVSGFVARALRESAGGWAAATALSAGTLYAVASGLNGVLLGAETYGGHHGATAASLALLDGVRAFAIYGSFLVLGMFLLATAVAAWVTLPRWLSYSGLVLGAALALSAAAAASGPAFLVYLLSYVWFVGLGVVLARHPAARRVLPVAATA